MRTVGTRISRLIDRLPIAFLQAGEHFPMKNFCLPPSVARYVNRGSFQSMTNGGVLFLHDPGTNGNYLPCPAYSASASILC